MATVTEILTLRRLTAELDDVEPWTDEVLAGIIDGASSLDLAALAVWEQKAALAASLVDTSESGSTRRMSQLHEQALKQIAYLRNKTNVSTQPPDLAAYSYTLPIERV